MLEYPAGRDSSERVEPGGIAQAEEAAYTLPLHFSLGLKRPIGDGDPKPA